MEFQPDISMFTAALKPLGTQNMRAEINSQCIKHRQIVKSFLHLFFSICSSWLVTAWRHRKKGHLFSFPRWMWVTPVSYCLFFFRFFVCLQYLSCLCVCAPRCVWVFVPWLSLIMFGCDGFTHSTLYPSLSILHSSSHHPILSHHHLFRVYGRKHEKWFW